MSREEQLRESLADLETILDQAEAAVAVLRAASSMPAPEPAELPGAGEVDA